MLKFLKEEQEGASFYNVWRDQDNKPARIHEEGRMDYMGTTPSVRVSDATLTLNDGPSKGLTAALGEDAETLIWSDKDVWTRDSIILNPPLTISFKPQNRRDKNVPF